MASTWIDCPSCGWEGKIDDGLVGRRLRCKKCGVSFVAEVGGTYDLQQTDSTSGAGPPSRPKATAASPVPDDPDEDKAIDGVGLQAWLDRWPAD